MTRPGLESSISCFLRGKERADGVFIAKKAKIWLVGARKLGGAEEKMVSAATLWSIELL